MTENTNSNIGGVLLPEEVEALAKSEADSIVLTDEPKKEAEKKPLNFGPSIDDMLVEEIYEFSSAPHSSLLFYSACILAASLFLCSAYSFGLNKASDNEAIENTVKIMQTSDENYRSAYEEYDVLSNEIKTLASEALDIQAISGTLNDYESASQALEKKLEDAKNEFQAKNDELYSLRQEIANMSANSAGSRLELSPGVYNVGKNIPEGVYNVVGNGTLLASTAAKENKENLQLSMTSNTKVELKSGYIVKISHNTVFTPISSAQ